jgi:ApaG protein
MPHRVFFYRETHGFRVTVRPSYLANESDEHIGRYVFSYHVRIENCSRVGAQLLSRTWIINDSIGEEYHVSGDGVVGQQPLLLPGDIHEYRSFCVLKSGHGCMTGVYSLVDLDAHAFDIHIPTFQLDIPDPSVQ